ncbi:YCF48-related protein [Zavarzinia compransoris]|uniref:WD40/YVTN/BNR-like repeat-containing protein n=1 Tax=Zavarzinia marina TaxID=2911065 RepID=UPI001F1DB148|nr:YCF48-related protein [Zavarzinia marina]MCF4165753.1 YCF48-related protein [Zavarzinia marina]
MEFSRRQLLMLGAGTAFTAGVLALSGPARAAVPAPRLYPDSLFGIAIDGEHAVASGYHGAVAIADGDLSTWVAVSSGTSDLLRRVVRRPEGGYVAVSHRGRILESNQDGRDWRVIHEKAGTYMRAVDFADAERGWAVGHGGTILHTSDGGKSWREQALSDYQGRDLPRLSGVAAIDRRRAMAVGEFGVVAVTEDAGRSWRVLTEQSYPTLLDVAVAGDRGFAVGLNGTLLSLRRDDYGAWDVSPIPTGTEQHFLAVALSADGAGGLIGGNGLLLTLSAKGLAPADVSDRFPLSYSWIGGVAIGDDGRAVAVGQGGAILRADALDGTFTPAATVASDAAPSTEIEQVTQ